MAPAVYRFVLSAGMLILLTGCWDRSELPSKGFVMGVALDRTDDGQFEMTTQVFKPSQGLVGMRTSDKSTVNIVTHNHTVSKAIRDIPIHLGRKTMWGHARILIISEQLAREQNVLETLDFFYRDHEPRLTTSLVIAKGKASKYLEIKPLIENTISQQFHQSSDAADMNSSKTINTNLLDLGLQLKSQVGNATVPYLYLTEDHDVAATNVAGVALLKKGVMVGLMKPFYVESLQMLQNNFNSGMVAIACPHDKKKEEAVEVLFLSSAWKPVIVPDQPLRTHIAIKADVALLEAACTKLETQEDEQRFKEKIEDNIRNQVLEMITWLQRNKFDALGLGNKVYQQNPTLWKKWKPNWEDRFAESEFSVNVSVHLSTTGTSIGKPT
ncbi:Ger(x)C family spore germination protein [Paenibacillus ferrarius]|uniref:Ger(x)C family spore germination protein n=1 Tax=Paenibacillus ferrarius TaxID=1469647 RepID=UPI003D2CCD3A